MPHLWHNGRIGHAEMSDAMHPQSVIHHCHGITGSSHLARARLMILGTGVLAHSTAPVLLAQEWILGAGRYRAVIQSHIVLGHGTGIGKRQSNLDALDEDRHVHGIAQVVTPDDRLREGIVTGEAKVPWNKVYYPLR